MKASILTPPQAQQTMPLFWKPYTSDVTNFIDSLKAKKPSLESEQRAGRALLWDRSLNRTEQADWADANVPQQPYVYQTKTRP
jgi:hypothetical protein